MMQHTPVYLSQHLCILHLLLHVLITASAYPADLLLGVSPCLGWLRVLDSHLCLDPWPWPRFVLCVFIAVFNFLPAFLCLSGVLVPWHRGMQKMLTITDFKCGYTAGLHVLGDKSSTHTIMLTIMLLRYYCGFVSFLVRCLWWAKGQRNIWGLYGDVFPIFHYWFIQRLVHGCVYPPWICSVLSVIYILDDLCGSLSVSDIYIPYTLLIFV